MPTFALEIHFYKNTFEYGVSTTCNWCNVFKI